MSITALCILMKVMVTPIGNLDRVRNSAAQAISQAKATAPAGSGAFPTTVQPAAEIKRELGYIETCVSWVGTWVSSILKKVFFFFFQATGPTVDPSPAISSPQIPEDIQKEVDLLYALEQLGDKQKERIYYQIGIKASRWFYPRQWRHSYEEIGLQEVKNNPLI